MREYTSGRFWTVVLLGVGLVLAPGAAYLASHGARPPEAALIDKLPRGCLSVTDGVVAGPLILARPDVKVWIDGRADFYGREHLGAAYRLYLGVDPIPEGATCALFPVASPENRMQQMQASLDADPTWVRLGEDKGYRLWARTG